MRDLIVILSSLHDLTAQQVMVILQQKGARAILMDAGDFPSRICLHAHLLTTSASIRDSCQGKANGHAFPITWTKGSRV